MKKLVLLSIAAITFVSCTHDFGNYGEAYIDPSTLQDKDPNEVTKEDIQANVASIFGTIDPEQDWNLITSGTVSISANAPLSDISKVQILTESPFLNNNAKVLNEQEAKYGDVITMNYDAPNVYNILFAACVSSRGEYYVQVFTPGTENVYFNTNRARTRATASDVPSFTTLKLKAPKPSFNALRAAEGASVKIGNKIYTEWNNSKWNDEVWELADGQTFDNGWKLDSEAKIGHMYRDISGFEDGELENVQAIINTSLVKYVEGTTTRRNNIESIRNSEKFRTDLNYVTTDGINPVTLIPIQGYTDDFKRNNIYYYYYRPEDIPADMNEVDYIKQLPKFKAIMFMRVQTTPEKNAGAFYRRQEFLLPFYKNAPVEGVNEASAIFPEGYKIGFLNRKCNPDGRSRSMPNEYKEEKVGCTYSDGRLNYEINHIPDFSTSVTLGMTWTDPRIAIFTANDKTYMTFEDGADCNFSDMIIEIGSGIKKVEEHYDIDYLSYMMCFEDSPIEYYDMNDVVLKFERQNQTTVKATLLACGAYDELYLKGLDGSILNDSKEIHALFDVPTKSFVNTDDKTKKTPISETFTINATQRLSDFVKKIYVYDATQGRDITLSGQGDDPHAIVVPADFEYPLEKTCIKTAYPLFSNWVQKATSDRMWFEECKEEFVYKRE